jgi:RHS repeat-associated protein
MTERVADLSLNWDFTDFRNYDPQLGRLHQIDPIDKEDQSPYSWVVNNPINYNDPLGLDTIPQKVVDWPNFDVVNNEIVLPAVNISPSSSQESSSESTGVSDLSSLGGWEGQFARSYDRSWGMNNGNWNYYRNNDLVNPYVWSEEEIQAALDVELQIALMLLPAPKAPPGIVLNSIFGSGKGFSKLFIRSFVAKAAAGQVRIKLPPKRVTDSGYTYTTTAGKHLTDRAKKGEHANRLSRPFMNYSLVIKEIMSAGKGVPDATFKGGMNWKVPGTFRDNTGIWELGLNPETGVIYHFNFVH